MKSRLLLTGLSLLLAGSAARAAELKPADVEFFEKKIRPVLVERCYKCHSAEAAKSGKLKAGLALDNREALLKGGASGATIVPGKPDAGTMLKALRHSDDLKMPPNGKLPDAVIADFAAWIQNGAADPRTTVIVSGRTIDLVKGRTFWSFQAPKKANLPMVKKTSWPAGDLDRFILARLEEKGLEPVRTAERSALVRRVYFDLVGLPPPPEVVEAFCKDDRPQAYPELIDRLLASPAYGERSARHWLDVARYAEDQAHTFGVKPKTNAWRYRDWVIKAFNDDMPYDKFVRLQIAGDLVDPAEGDLVTRIAGLGFLGLGAEYYKNSDREQVIADELDDRVDTLTRGFLGLTVACARCHDHKFDPIPTSDYYAIAGIFNGSQLTEAPLAPPEEVRKYNESQRPIREQEERIRAFLNDAGKQRGREETARVGRYLTTAWRLHAIRSAGFKVSVDEVAAREKLPRYFLDRWVTALDPSNAGKTSPLLKEWFVHKPAAGMAKTFADVVVSDAVQEFAKKFQQQITEAVERPNPDKDKEKAREQLLKFVWLDGNAPLFIKGEDYERLLLTNDQKLKLLEMRAELQLRKKAVPPMYPEAHVLQGGGQTMHVYLRGNPRKQGDLAPKGMLQVLTPAETKPSANYSRLDLANAIASKDNPVTARVLVNRVWQQHFGRGLVGTASNFGELGERPTHPELLDWLAVRFLESGWSMKWLHREILLSATYRLSSVIDRRNAEKDGDNRLLWRMNRRRLDVEGWRDALLSVSGQLDTKLGGPTFELRDANSKRRTVYAKVSRHELDGLLRMFDFPDANVTSDRRVVTTVPQQQLFVLNSEFMADQARALAGRLQKSAAADPERIRLAYRLAYGRLAHDTEVRLGQAYLAVPADASNQDRLTRWEQYAQALLAANEFLYID